MANGLGELTYLDDDPQWSESSMSMMDPGRWAVRGDYRLRANTGNDLQQLVNGQWQNFTPTGGDYDPRTDGHVVDSNERRRFLQGFLSAPVGFDINSGGAQGIATAQGWKEPDRSGGSGFGHFLTHFALPAAGMAFGAGALSEALGAGSSAGSSGGLSWLGNEGLATIPEAVGALPSAGASAGLEGLELGGWGSGALDPLEAEYVNTLGDWPIAPEYNPGSVMDAAMNPATGGSPQYASQDVVDLFDRAGTPGFDQYGNPSSFLDTLKGALRSIPGGALGSGNDLLGKILGGLTAYAQNQSAKTAAENNPAYKLPANYGNTLNPTNWAMLRRAEGGGIPGEPEEAGFAGYVQGADSGQSDGVHALLSPGEYVFDADTVSALGDGNNEAGAGILDQMRENIRRHKRSAPTDEIPPEALSPEQYLEGAE